jgi:G:T-mismatch repair DNA endonuclease (very short patch repair protein)
MRDVKSKMCIGCNEKHPSFGLEDGKATHCAVCKTADMRDVVSQMCVGCNKVHPSFGLEDGVPTHCADCKTPDMRDVIHKMCIGCNMVRPSFGLEDSNATHCADCKTPDMRDVVSQMCAVAGCKTHASSGTTWAPRTHCAQCVKQFWKLNAVPLPNRVNSRGDMPSAAPSYSRVAIDFLTWIARTMDIADMEHAETAGGERVVSVFTSAASTSESDARARRFKLDGFSAACNTAFEFHGCFYHGCAACYPKPEQRAQLVYTKSMAERYDATLAREQTLRNAGYTVVSIWEHEWRAMQGDAEAKARFLQRVCASMTVVSARVDDSDNDAGSTCAGSAYGSGSGAKRKRND